MSGPDGARPLAGRNVVVTGASRGIGEAVARRAAAEGANVVVNSSGAGGTDPGPLTAVAESITAEGGTAVASVGPVEDLDYACLLYTSDAADD